MPTDKFEIIRLRVPFTIVAETFPTTTVPVALLGVKIIFTVALSPKLISGTLTSIVTFSLEKEYDNVKTSLLTVAFTVVIPYLNVISEVTVLFPFL